MVMNRKIELFRDMHGWDEMKAAMHDLPDEEREAFLLRFIDFICGMII